MPDHPADHADAAADILRLEDVRFSYAADGAARPILRGASLSLPPGLALGLHGPNGSGKTTLFRCITGLNRIQGGRILLRGREMRREEDFHELRCRVGFVLQNAEDQLFFPTVLEDVAFGPLNLGLAPDDARRRARETLAELGLEGFADRLTHRLSGGERRLVSLAAVLAMRPDALLLDEPANELDEASRERLVGILLRLPAARITVSHDRDFLARVSTRFLSLRDGILAPDSPDPPAPSAPAGKKGA